MNKLVSAVLFLVMTASAPVQAVVTYSGNLSGSVTADVDHAFTGHDQYASGPIIAPYAAPNTITRSGMLSIDNGSGGDGAVAYYGMSASAGVSFNTPERTVLYGSTYNYIDGYTDGMSTYNGTSYAESVFNFTLDREYSFDFFLSPDEFFYRPEYPSQYAALVRIGGGEVFSGVIWSRDDVLNFTGSLSAGSYRLTVVNDIDAASPDPQNPYGLARLSYSLDLQATPVPEPATYWLFGLGLAGLVVITWRRKQLS